MALYQLDDVWGYQDANDAKKLWAGSSAPSSPGTGEVWLDTSSSPALLKKYNGSSWDVIGFTRDDFWRDNTSDETENVFMQSGRDTFTFNGVSITFDVAFSDTPRVICGNGEDDTCHAYAMSVSTTGFTAKMRDRQGSKTSLTCSWLAIGKKT